MHSLSYLITPTVLVVRLNFYHSTPCVRRDACATPCHDSWIDNVAVVLCIPQLDQVPCFQCVPDVNWSCEPRALCVVADFPSRTHAEPALHVPCSDGEIRSDYDSGNVAKVSQECGCVTYFHCNWSAIALFVCTHMYSFSNICAHACLLLCTNVGQRMSVYVFCSRVCC